MVVNELATQISAPAKRVWHLLTSEQGQQETLSDFIGGIEFSGYGVGAVRTMYVHGHLGEGYLKEKVTHFDENVMEIHYRIIDTGGIIPFADYTGQAHIYEAGPDACVLLLRSTFVPVDMEEAAALTISKENFQLFIKRFHQHFDVEAN